MPKRRALWQKVSSVFDAEGDDLSIDQKIALLDEALLTLNVNYTDDIKSLRNLLKKILQLLDREHVLARLWTRQILAGECPIGIERPEVCEVGDLCSHWHGSCCSFVPMKDPNPHRHERPFKPLRTGVKQRLA